MAWRWSISWENGKSLGSNPCILAKFLKEVIFIYQGPVPQGTIIYHETGGNSKEGNALELGGNWQLLILDN